MREILYGHMRVYTRVKVAVYMCWHPVCCLHNRLRFSVARLPVSWNLALMPFRRIPEHTKRVMSVRAQSLEMEQILRTEEIFRIERWLCSRRQKMAIVCYFCSLVTNTSFCTKSKYDDLEALWYRTRLKHKNVNCCSVNSVHGNCCGKNC